MNEECAHPSKSLRFKVNAAGLRMYIYQCAMCWSRVGSWLKKAEVDESSAVPFDEEAEQRERERGWKARTAEYQRERDSRNAEWRSRYQSHLHSDKWRDLCRRVWQRDGGNCQGCLRATGAHVHHKTYEHMGDELLFELVLLCRSCHEKIHPHMVEACS